VRTRWIAETETFDAIVLGGEIAGGFRYYGWNATAPSLTKTVSLSVLGGGPHVRAAGYPSDWLLAESDGLLAERGLVRILATGLCSAHLPDFDWDSGCRCVTVTVAGASETQPGMLATLWGASGGNSDRPFTRLKRGTISMVTTELSSFGRQGNRRQWQRNR
jgi:hypothetical protein